jgi:hypothetical protein
MSNRLAALSANLMAVLGIQSAAAETEDTTTETVTETVADPADPADAGETEAAPADTPEDAPAADVAAAVAAAAAEARMEANLRWATVLSSKEATGRTKQAVDMLATTELSADAICQKIASYPKEGASAFAEQMAAEAPNPAVTADGTAAGKPDPRADNHGWNRAYAKAGVQPVK